MSRKITFAEGEYYHVYNRGTEKRKIFLSHHDYERFMALLYLCNNSEPIRLNLSMQGPTLHTVFNTKRPDTLVHLCAYCLMPNHLHLIVREKIDGLGGVSRFMQKLLTAYTMYFNIKNDRTGTLFEGRFKAKHVESDEYLKYLVSYVHLNPVKIIDPLWKENGITDKKIAEKHLKKYRFSSYRDFLGEKRSESVIIDKGALPEYFESSTDFTSTTNEWLSFKEL